MKDRHLRLGRLHIHLQYLRDPTMVLWLDAHYSHGEGVYDDGWLAAVHRYALFIGKGGSHG